MGNVLLSFIFAAGAGAFVYAKVGRRLGYTNTGNVWTIVGITSFLTFLVFMILFGTLVDLS